MQVSVVEPGPVLHNLVQVSVGQPAPALDNLARTAQPVPLPESAAPLRVRLRTPTPQTACGENALSLVALFPSACSLVPTSLHYQWHSLTVQSCTACSYLNFLG